MSRSLAYTLIVVAATLLTFAGCASGDDDVTRTEELRRELSPRTQQLMIEGQRAYEAGNYLAALAMADSAQFYAPNLADVHFLRGSIFARLSRYDVANQAYGRALELDPEYPGANMNIGINYARSGNLRDAIERFRDEERVNPSSSLYLEIGRAYAQLGVADSAMTAYEQAIERDGTNATAFMWLGQLHEEMGEFERAIGYSRRGASLRPANLDYKYIIGSQLFRTDSVEQAVEFLRPVAEARPWHHGAQYNMGQALIRMGREDEGQQFLTQADTAQQWQQEINEATDAIERSPDELQNWIRLANAHRTAGMYSRAADALRSAIAMEPRNMGLHINLATLMLENNDAAGAVRHYKAVVAFDSTVTEAWLNLGVAHGNAGQYDEAEDAWQRVLVLEPGHTQARAHLSQLRQLRGS